MKEAVKKNPDKLQILKVLTPKESFPKESTIGPNAVGLKQGIQDQRLV